MEKVFLTGENMNIMSKTIGPAMRERDPEPIRKLAEIMAASDVDYIDINLGPARKEGGQMMQFVVKTVQEVTDKPLFLDTTNMDAMEAGLQIYKHGSVKPVINSIMARPDRMEALLPMAKKYDAACVGLLWGPEGLPRDENERGMLAADFLMKAEEAGVANEDIFMDPIVVPVSSQQIQVQGCTNFMMMFRDIAPGCKGTCGLSNISNGAPEHLRPILNQVYMIIINYFGMSGAIMDYQDQVLTDICRGKKQELCDLVVKVFNGEIEDPSGLSKEQLDYYKTVKVLNGENLYSDSWLEV